MFGLLAPRCPVSTYEKAWAEWHLRRFAEQFGIERLLKAKVILPTEEFFPEAAGNLREIDIQRILDRLCGYLFIDRNQVRLEVRPDANTVPTIAPLEIGAQIKTIRILQEQLAQPWLLIPALVHELAHHKLLGRTSDDAHLEWNVELLPVYFGLGIFGANASMEKDFRASGTWNAWKAGRASFLPVRIFGYALALFAFVRRETSPEWAEFLVPDAYTNMQTGLRYLSKTGDSIFHPETISKLQLNRWSSRLLADLRSNSPSRRLATLWEIGQHSVAEASIVAAVSDCLTDRDLAVAQAAGIRLGQMGPIAAQALPALMHALTSNHPDVRGGAAYALGVLQHDPDVVVHPLAELLASDDAYLVARAAEALRSYGWHAESAAPQILAALKSAIIDCRFWLVDLLASTMLAVMPNPEEFVREHFADGDADFERHVLDGIEEQREAQASDVN